MPRFKASLMLSVNNYLGLDLEVIL
jgi:hypothetical protein